MKKFYITTPIYYINDVPHICHTCTTMAADFMARFHKILGDEVFFLTGTDEHGQKVAEAAEKEGLEPKNYCDKIAPRFEEAWRSLNIDFDFFIRTTDSRHEAVVGGILQKIYDNGDVYRGNYQGLYCQGCEKFVLEGDLVDGRCEFHPNQEPEYKTETNWFFKLKKYIPAIIDLVENDRTNYIMPSSKRREILSKLRAGVEDVSLSREKVKWGIPVPWDGSQTIYVWFDALLNYYSATEIVENGKQFWPANFHILAKDIIWFHTVIWQAMLLSAGLDLPKKTYIHSFYMVDGQKMSKSLGNVISPQQLIDLFGVDGTRYLIARSFPLENDSDVGMERFKARYNADLANNLGNLVSRVVKLKGQLPVDSCQLAVGEEYKKLIEELRFDEAIQLVFDKWVDASNNLLNQVAPWKLAEDDPKRIETLTTCVNNLRLAAYYLEPFIPETSKKIKNIFSGIIKPPEKPLFPRIVDDVKTMPVVKNKYSSGRAYWVDTLATEVGVKFQVAEIHGVKVKRKNSKLEKEKEVIAEVVERVDYVNDPILLGYKKLFETIGAKNILSSPDSLLQLVKGKGGLPTINTVVDAYNVKSLTTRLVVSAHDLDKLTGDIRIVTTTGREVFYPLGSTTGERLPIKEWAAVDDNHVLCRLNCKQSELSKVTLVTKNLLIYVQGNKTTSDEYLRQSLVDICEYIVKYNGGEYVALAKKH